MSLFAVLFGFVVIALACGLSSRDTRVAVLAITALICVGIILMFVAPDSRVGSASLPSIRSLFIIALTEETIWAIIGASGALVIIMRLEGTLGRFLPLDRISQSVGPLGARDELLIRLCLYAFQDSRRSILADLETALGARSGHKQLALQRLAAPGVSGMKRIHPESLVRTYKRAHDPALMTAPFIYSIICRLAVITGSNSAATSKRLHRIGRAFGLSRGEVNRAISLA